MPTDEYARIRDRSRMRVYERDDYRCQHCDGEEVPGGATELRVRHIVPRSRGGSDHPRNLLTLCRKCDSRLPEHHVIGSADRIELCRSADANDSRNGRVGEIALLLVGGCVLPFFTTLFLMTL